MNGLITVKRKQNGYRIYTDADIKQLKIIRSLRCANYSLSAILRMLTGLSKNPNADIRTIIDTPFTQDDIISACDMLLTSLYRAKRNAQIIYSKLMGMKKENNPPL
jgi:DNA-binding transcriptional MerR regulator